MSKTLFIVELNLTVVNVPGPFFNPAYPEDNLINPKYEVSHIYPEINFANAHANVLLKFLLKTDDSSRLWKCGKDIQEVLDLLEPYAFGKPMPEELKTFYATFFLPSHVSNEERFKSIVRDIYKVFAVGQKFNKDVVWT